MNDKWDSGDNDNDNNDNDNLDAAMKLTII